MIKDIFKVEIYKVKLDGVDNETLVDYINENGTIRDNPETCKSKDHIDVLHNKLFESLNDKVEEHVNKMFHLNVGENFKLKLNQAWFNKGSDELIIDPHKHQHSVFSAVYYPFSVDGRIRFLNPANSINYMLDLTHIRVWNEYIAEHHTENVRTGDLIVFRSGMFHWAIPSQYDRYSIAYNTGVV